MNLSGFSGLKKKKNCCVYDMIAAPCFLSFPPSKLNVRLYPNNSHRKLAAVERIFRDVIQFGGGGKWCVHTYKCIHKIQDKEDQRSRWSPLRYKKHSRSSNQLNFLSNKYLSILSNENRGKSQMNAFDKKKHVKEEKNKDRSMCVFLFFEK